MRVRDMRCGREDAIPATPTDSAKTPSDLHLIQIKQELEQLGSVSIERERKCNDVSSVSKVDSVIYFSY